VKVPDPRAGGSYESKSAAVKASDLRFHYAKLVKEAKAAEHRANLALAVGKNATYLDDMAAQCRDAVRAIEKEILEFSKAEGEK
jgi:hypothetical protein